MANIKYRESTTPAVPGSTTAKGTPLTNLEIDGNFKSINDDLTLKANSASPTITGTVTLSDTIASTSTGTGALVVAGGVGIAGDVNIGGTVDLSAGTGAIALPVGTTAQQPTATGGELRYNSETGEFEGFASGAWGAIGGGGGATGGAENPVFWENDQVVTANYTITAGKNAGTFGPVTIADGVTVTVPTGSNWTVV